MSCRFIIRLGVVVYIGYPSTWETESREAADEGQPELHSETQKTKGKKEVSW